MHGEQKGDLRCTTCTAKHTLKCLNCTKKDTLCSVEPHCFILESNNNVFASNV